MPWPFIWGMKGKGVEGGDDHDHEGGDGAQVDHASLGNKGTKLHSEIDTHVGGDGSDHEDVATNSEHVAGDGSDHEDVAANTGASHTRSHAITSGDDLTAGDWKIFFTRNDGVIRELALPSGEQFFRGNAPDGAPEFAFIDAQDLVGGNWKIVYTDGDGNMQELALGADGDVLTAGGAAAAPTFETPAAGGLGNVVEDTSPQLGGNLDFNENNIIISPACGGADHSTSGTIVVLTAGETVNFGDLCYQKAADGEYYLADASSGATLPGTVIALGTITNGNTGYFLKEGYIRDDTWSFDVRELVFATVTGTTGNTISSDPPYTQGDNRQVIGRAYSATVFYFNPYLEEEYITISRVGCAIPNAAYVGLVPFGIDSSGVQGYTYRYVIPNWMITKGGDQIRLQFGWVADTLGITEAYVGHKATGYAFDGNQVQVTWDVGATTKTFTEAYIESDWLTFDLDPGVDIVLAVYHNTGHNRQIYAPAQGYETYYKSGSDASTTAASGYTASGQMGAQFYLTAICARDV